MTKNKYYADDGWAIWVDGDDTSSIYLNEWMNPKGKSYVDVGIHIRGIKESKSLNIFIPFSIEKEEIIDLSLKIVDRNVLYAIFGASGIVDFKKNAFTSEVAYKGKTMDIVHISTIEYLRKNWDKGTLLTIPFDGLKDYIANDEAYYLFRIPHKSLEQIFNLHASVSNILIRLRDLVTSPLIIKHYGYSVRINEVRSLPVEITSIGTFHAQKLNKASISIAIPEDYEINDTGCYRIRRLEENLYRNFLPDLYKSEDIVVYQWKRIREKNMLGRFNFYFSMNHHTISKYSMIIYVAILVLIGAAGNATWDLIKFILHI